MKKITITLLLITLLSFDLTAQTFEFQIVTVIESIVPNGLGRSRMISATAERDFEAFTSEQTEEDNSRNKSKRSEIRVKDFEETKLLNFFNIGGIRFQNIASNDAVVTSKLNSMSEAGWELTFVNSGVESYGGQGDDNGIFVTRYLFRRPKQ
jgi:hypothetical protein